MENKYLKRAKEYRAITEIHYNCAQAVLAAYAPECGLTVEKAYQLGAHFGSGMSMGATCGAITGAIMVIGMLGGGKEEYRAFMKIMREHHDNLTDCKDLLRVNAEKGLPKHDHCDHMVFEAVEEVANVMHMN